MSKYQLPPRLFWVKVELKSSNNPVTFFWTDLTFELRTKYDWYFRYRAALLQVKFPRLIVEFTEGHFEAVGKPKADILKNRLAAKRSKVTKWKNQISLYQLELDKEYENWMELFPIQSSPAYQEKRQALKAAQDKLKAAEFELLSIEAEIIEAIQTQQ